LPQESLTDGLRAIAVASTVLLLDEAYKFLTGLVRGKPMLSVTANDPSK
jgi:hypothetical protein